MEEKEINFVDYLYVIVKWRKLIIINCVIITLIALIISFFIPKVYTAQTTLLPPASSDESSLISAGLSSLSGLGLGGLMGGSLKGMLGFSDPTDLFLAILKSGTVNTNIVKRFDLLKVYKLEKLEKKYPGLGYERAVKRLRKDTSISTTDEGLILIRVQTKNPFGIVSRETDLKTRQLCADIANAFVEELDKINQSINITQSRQKRIFIGKRLDEVKRDLAVAEDSLRKFQETHKTIYIEEEAKAAIETIGTLKAQEIALQVQLETLKQFSTGDNPQISQIVTQLSAIRKELAKMTSTGSSVESKDKKDFGAGFSIPLSNLPEVGLELARLMRDVKIQSELYALLVAQYEQAKIQEAKDTPTVQVLDKASPPAWKTKPKKAIIIIEAFMISLIGGIFLAFSLQYFENIKNDSVLYGKWEKVLVSLSFINEVKLWWKNIVKKK